MEQTFVITLVSPFSGQIRGEVVKMPKIFFVDTGLRNSCIGSFELTGETLENGFFATINNAYKAKEIRFYRTKDGQEIDFILDGEPYEVKLSYNGKRLSAMKYFMEKYKKQGKMITLHKNDGVKDRLFFPWEV
ncbi:MAG: DUF4143 domain-containing protein [Bacteroidales bacterium]|nr:DUF4143 domain-containing protein [Bacteroidales bacterium]